MPENSDQPAANSMIKSSVAPLNPASVARPRPTTSPIAPPGVDGSVTGSL
jgi:hypothetical protein